MLVVNVRFKESSNFVHPLLAQNALTLQERANEQQCSTQTDD